MRAAGPLTLYHGTSPSFTLKPHEPIHLGTQQQATMRGRGKVVAFTVTATLFKRTRDAVGDWGRPIAAARRQGYEGLVYLNRYEGIPLARVLALAEQGYAGERLDALPDHRFKRLVPEAADSYLLLSGEGLSPV